MPEDGIPLEGVPEAPPTPTRLPVFPLRRAVIFPAMVAPVAAEAGGEAKMIDDALAGDRMIAVVAAKDPDKEVLTPDDLYTVGASAQILKMMKMPDDSRRLLIRGVSRVEITGYIHTDPYLVAGARTREDIISDEQELEPLQQQLLTLFKQVVEVSPYLPDDVYVHAINIESASTIADLVASNLNIEVAERQELLETFDVNERMRKVIELTRRELAGLAVAQEVQSEAKGEMEKAQREYYLRQQLRAIQKELGEEDSEAAQIEELREKIEQAEMSPEAREAAERELNRLRRMSPASAEYTVCRTYLDWLTELPWTKSSEDKLAIAEAQKVLDADHHDLDKVKDRVVEYLAVRKLKDSMHGPILCFVGPPGVGKTSLGRSIARAMGRKFVRISLGGVRDEAEIRGHRRTYVGALPGRIIQGLRTAGTNNPVFMLDEVDKLGADFRGDPSAALLEVLDPEQNFSFQDHYLDVPFDLSKVLFITTANVLHTVPPALQDRMEVLSLPGYPEEDKLIIARKFLVPRQREEHGLKAKQCRFSPAVLKAIIRDYTREAGLRNLEREIGTICRKVARQVAADKPPPKVTVKNLHEFLGPPKFFAEVRERVSRPGVVCGLAYTQQGGEVLFIEATIMPGKGHLTLTGQLGDVMQESAHAAVSYVRANAARLGIEAKVFQRNDLHIHVPSGGVPKDGPSAGVTMVTALASLLTDRPARPDLAMTGEITLRGKVLPVGGIKEKCLAARRAGIKTVILPRHNENDLEDLGEQVKKQLEFRFVDTLDEVLEIALRPAKARRRRKSA